MTLQTGKMVESLEMVLGFLPVNFLIIPCYAEYKPRFSLVYDDGQYYPTSETHFINPASDGVIVQHDVWPIGSVQNISWVTNFSTWHAIAIIQKTTREPTTDTGRYLWDYDNANKTEFYEMWKVDHMGFNYIKYPTYYFALLHRQNFKQPWLLSKTFNISDPDPSSSSTSTVPSPTTITPASTVPSSILITPASTPIPSPLHSTYGLPLGLGLGLGLPALLLFGIFVGMKIVKSRRSDGQTSLRHPGWTMPAPSTASMTPYNGEHVSQILSPHSSYAGNTIPSAELYAEAPQGVKPVEKGEDGLIR